MYGISSFLSVHRFSGPVWSRVVNLGTGMTLFKHADVKYVTDFTEPDIQGNNVGSW